MARFNNASDTKSSLLAQESSRVILYDLRLMGKTLHFGGVMGYAQVVNLNIFHVPRGIELEDGIIVLRAYRFRGVASITFPPLPVRFNSFFQVPGYAGQVP